MDTKSRLIKTDTLDLQQRPPEYGYRRHHPRTETENGRVSSTNAPRQKWGDYHLIRIGASAVAGIVDAGVNVLQRAQDAAAAAEGGLATVHRLTPLSVVAKPTCRKEDTPKR